MNALDLTKPVRTQAGEPVEIISTNGRQPFPIIGYIGSEDGRGDMVRAWTIDGVYFVWDDGDDDHHYFDSDLVNL